MPGPNSHTHQTSEVEGISRYDLYDLLPGVFPMGMIPATTLQWTVKRAYFSRFTVSRRREFKFVRWAIAAVGSGEDKVDVGIYVVNGAKLERLGSSGAKVSTTNAVGVKVTEMTATVVCEPGVAYFVAWGAETLTGTPQVLAMVNNNGNVGDIFGTGALANRFQLFKAETFVLPATVEALGGSTPVPWLVPSES